MNQLLKRYAFAVSSICSMCAGNIAIAEDPQSGVYLGGYADAISFDDDLDLDAALGGALGFGYLRSNWGFEVAYHILPTEHNDLNFDVDVSWISLDATYFTQSAFENSPYIRLGVSNLDFDPDVGEGFDEDSARFGFGYQYWFDKNTAFRMELQGLYGLDEDYLSAGASLGLIYFFGGSKPAKPQPAAPKDSDGDGVYDDRDRCPSTVPGTSVDATGCAKDSDGDGVIDTKDRCPSTNKGVKVDAQGCALDSDKDGVIDNADKCPNTPKGAVVDQEGCAKKLTEKVSIELKVEFDLGKATLRPGADSEIQKVADFLVQYPSTQAVIEGHTDSQGAASFNQKLSEKRAHSVRSRLLEISGVDASRVSAIGYGESKPIADNSTASGRQKNRRVVASISATVEKK